MAAYFSLNAKRIQAFSETLSRGSLKLQIRTVAFIVISIGLLLLLYMGVMSDMGPALVIIITFILLYAIARRDVGPMLLGIASYLLLSWLARMLPVSFLFGQILASLLWLGLWVAGGYFTSHRLYESAIFFNLLLFAFISGGGIMMKLGMESEGQRLLDRQQVAESLWNNDVTGGGDQVVQGIWSLATGGLTGQGLGKGDPNLVPAFNTDMIFTSIGEEMGFVVLLLLIVCCRRRHRSGDGRATVRHRPGKPWNHPADRRGRSFPQLWNDQPDLEPGRHGHPSIYLGASCGRFPRERERRLCRYARHDQ